MCGEKYCLASIAELFVGSPPHVRGKVTRRTCARTEPRITPACAGKSKTVLARYDIEEDHPRMCGEKCTIILSQCKRKGSPPHVRGKANVGTILFPIFGITPACAGKRLFMKGANR